MSLPIASPASAQDAPVEDASAGETLATPSTIIVTGSRIQRPGGFGEQTPVTVLGSEAIDDLGIVNTSDIVGLIPSNNAVASQANAGTSSGADIGAAYANLRGLNPARGTRTLTLVNTRRFVPTSTNMSVDLNLIPTAMIERVETVTGGASAAYGSDAIAGVVNILLDTDLEGLRFQADYGQTFRGDGEDYHASLVYGTRVTDRGHLVIGGEYQKAEGILKCAEVRQWCAEGYDLFENDGDILPDGSRSGYNIPGSPTYGQPHYIIGPGSKRAFNASEGVVRDREPAAPAARNKIFTRDGTGILDFDPGIYVDANTTGNRQGGDGEPVYTESAIQVPVERYVGYLYGEYELSDALTISTELSYAHRTAYNNPVVAGPRSTFFVQPDNAYLPQELEDLLDGTAFSLSKDMDLQLLDENNATSEVWRGLVGLNYALSDSWSVDFYYQYGQNNRHQERKYSRVNTPFQYALDAVDEGEFLTGTPNGNIVCREQLAADPDPRAADCAPLNLFGVTNLTPEAVAYAYRPVLQDFTYKQHVAAATLSGDLFAGIGAGPISAALGAEYRHEVGDVYHGDIPFYNDYAFTFGTDYGGTIEVVEAFSELNVPVLADVPFAEILELNGALRWTRNTSRNDNTQESKTTDIWTYKLSGIWEIGGGVRLRASRSRDIRAAGFQELFDQQVPTEEGSSQGLVDNPNIPGGLGNGDDATPILNGGSFALEPEKADTTTAGVVFRPAFAPGLRLSADWYQIELEDAVAALPGQQIVDFCADFDLFCERITFASPTDITFVDARQVNVGKQTVRGFDFEVDYRQRLEDWSSALAGTLGLRVLANHQYDYLVQADPTTPIIDYAGQTGPLQVGGDFNPGPEWIVNGFLSYDNGGFNTVLSVRHLAPGIYDVERTGPEDPGYDPGMEDSINTNRVDGATYFGLAMSYEIPLDQDFGRAVEIFGKIDNLFDKKPPIAPGGGNLGGSYYPTNPVYFDTYGARFRTGIRVRY